MEGAGNVKLYNDLKGGAIIWMQQGNRNPELRYLGFLFGSSYTGYVGEEGAG